MTTSIEVTINGQHETLDDDVTAEKLVHSMSLGRQRIAVEINGEIVPRSTFAERRIAPGDRIEIVRAVGGG
ncbi:MAG: sulfur carrier protein ThiS [Gammaproteobacteria bacterium]|nr:sulfur carrier protein ThiS [Gammaproteobacteria bacterium]